MRISTKAGALAGALDYVAAAIPRREVIPILADCRIEVVGGRVVITTTDLDVLLSAELEAPDSDPGVAVAPCARLAKLLGELPGNADVTVALDGDRLVVKCGRGKWSLATLLPQDFPQLDGPGNDAVSFVLPKAEARRLVARVEHAISTEETRYYLSGTYLTRRSDQLIAVATNGHVLAEISINQDPGPAMPSVIIPRRAFEILAELDGDVQLRVADDRIEFVSGGRACTSKLVDGTFPDYARVIPAASDNHVEVASADLLAATERLKAVASPGVDLNAIGITWDSDGLQLCLAREESAGAEQLDATIAGSGRVALQARYLIETVKALNARSIMLDYEGSVGPVRFTTSETGTTMVVMPVAWLKPAVADPPPRKRKRAA